MLHPGSLPVGVEVMAQPPGETKDSQLLQDFLLDMDFDEFIPVNNFFSGYVQALDDGCQSGASFACTVLAIRSPCAPSHTHSMCLCNTRVLHCPVRTSRVLVSKQVPLPLPRPAPATKRAAGARVPCIMVSAHFSRHFAFASAIRGLRAVEPRAPCMGRMLAHARLGLHPSRSPSRCERPNPRVHDENLQRSVIWHVVEANTMRRRPCSQHFQDSHLPMHIRSAAAAASYGDQHLGTRLSMGARA